MQLLATLGLAFLGGLILNVMPCVLPVLTLKAFTLIEYSREDPRRQRIHGVGYAIGTISALLALAVAVLVIRAAGKSMGWGMQFQHPGFVAVLTTIVFVFGLNALGVFELHVGSSADEKSGFLGSVANGWFAAVMATPCSAPFLGPAAGFALAAETPGWLTLVVFAVIGLGLAFPFAALAFVPGVGRWLPRPGAWMESFKQLMGFTLLGAAVWLYRVLLRQLTPESASFFLAFLLLVAIVLWASDRWAGLEATRPRRWGVRAVSAVVVAGAAFGIPFERRVASPPVASQVGEPVVMNGKINWLHFDPKAIDAQLASGRPVFLDYTADWCATCQANDKLFVDTPKVHAALQRSGVVPVKVDMTDEDPVTEAWLAKTGRNAIPVYVVLTPGGKMDLLPEAITTEMLVTALARNAVRID